MFLESCEHPALSAVIIRGEDARHCRQRPSKVKYPQYLRRFESTHNGLIVVGMQRNLSDCDLEQHIVLDVAQADRLFHSADAVEIRFLHVLS